MAKYERAVEEEKRHWLGERTADSLLIMFRLMFSLRTGSLLHLPSSLRAPPFCSNKSSKMVSNAVTGFSISIKKQKKHKFHVRKVSF